MVEKRNKTAGDVLTNMSMPILLVVLIVFFSIMSRNFLTPLNITNILVQNVHEYCPYINTFDPLRKPVNWAFLAIVPLHTPLENETELPESA